MKGLVNHSFSEFMVAFVNDVVMLWRSISLAFWLILILGGGSGCRSVPEAADAATHRSSQLQAEIIAMDAAVSHLEAKRIAKLAVQKASELTEEYKAMKPAWFHNVLVNYGFRERGLCFEWTNDLYLSLLDLRPGSVDLHLVVSKMDTPKEHNAIAVTPRGQSITNGLVLDAWRQSGHLWFGPVKGDKYDWVPLPPERFNPRIKKKLREH